ncbi:DUF418 domain-containing protein [Haloferula sp. BvORR071]|uniref:DUF418 domain-containing protein n=1 Tax=Haloferula sp. BvORR071 TaxID=1396141 RepID=UPI0005577970|nr:DUF418 domain-containing protein [Haloferula sp. BvORR071]
MTSLPPAETPPPQRIPELDVFRGIAILGILLLNIRDFSMSSGAYWWPASYDHFQGWRDHLAWALTEIFGSRKFYSTLALLFGAGIFLMSRDAARPASSHYRRMIALFLLGLLHAYLIWPGDILYHYAICGAIAYPFRRLGPRVLALLGVILLTGSIVSTTHEALHLQSFFFDSRDYPESLADELEIYRGPWLGQSDTRIQRARDSREFLRDPAFLAETLGLMFIGIALVKRGWPAATRGSPHLWPIAILGCILGWGIAAFSIGAWALTGFQMGGHYLLMSTGMTLASLPTIAGYLAAAQLWLGSGKLPAAANALAAIGRTALSNYLLQSLLATFIFHGQGLGLIGTLGRDTQLLVVLLIWTIQITLTLFWLDHHPRGPVESLLRRISGRNRPEDPRSNFFAQ